MPSGTNVGSVFFDVGYNQKGLQKSADKGAKGLEKTFGTAFSKIGKWAAAAFGVAAVINFGKESVNAYNEAIGAQERLTQAMRRNASASNEQIQNIFDLTDAWQQYGVVSASVQQAGLQELATYAGETSSLETLLPVLNDMVVQQYGFNASQEQAQNIATSLGKILNGQTGALSRYGYWFSEAEDAILKYGTEAEAAATLAEVVTRSVGGMNEALGNTPTGKITQLKNNFGQLKEVIGEGLVLVFSQFAGALNAVISRLIAVVKIINGFIAAVFGIETSLGAVGGAGGGLADLGDAAEDAGDAAAKGAKKAKGAVASFDELNNLKDDSNSGSGGAGGLGDFELPDMSAITSLQDQTDSFFDNLAEQAKKLINEFKNGFKEGLGDDFFASLERTKGHLQGIKESLIDIFSDPAVQNAAWNLAESYARNFGRIAGSFASIGATIAENLTGGLDKYLQQNTPYIKERLINIFDNQAAILDIVGETVVEVAKIFEVFRGPTAKQITADLIAIFANSQLGIQDLAGRIGRDVIDLITYPIRQNGGKIRTALENTLKPIQTITGSISDFVTNTFSKIFEVYETKVQPAFDRFKEGWNSVVGNLLDKYNQYIAPTLQRLGEKWADVVDNHIQPAVNKFVEYIGVVVEWVSLLWENVLAPFINWIIDTIVPIIVPIWEKLRDTFLNVFAAIWDILGGFWEVLKGFMDFIIGVFTGDWERAWEGIKGIFQGVLDIIMGIAEAFWSFLTGIFETIYLTITGIVEFLWETVKAAFVTAFDFLSGLVENVWGFIVYTFENAGEIISDLIETVWNFISGFIEMIMEKIQGVINTVWNAIRGVIDTISSAIKEILSAAWNWIKTTITTLINGIKDSVTAVFTNIRTTVTTITDAIKNGVSNAWTTLKNGVVNTVTALKNGVVGAFQSIWSGIKGIINTIIGGIDLMINGIVKGINTATSALNSIGFTVPDWVPGIGGKGFHLNIPQVPTVSLPKLAEGGIVDNPTLALIGEAGKEAVVPLQNNTEWMVKLANTVAEAIVSKLLQAQGGQNTGLTDENTTLKLEVDGRTLGEVALEYLVEAAQRRGYQLLIQR